MQRLDLLLAKEMFDVQEDKQSIYNAFVKYDFSNNTIYNKDEKGNWVPKAGSFDYRKSDVILIGEDVCIRWDKWPARDIYTLLSKDKNGNYTEYNYFDNARFHPARIVSLNSTVLGHLCIRSEYDTYFFQKTQNGYEQCLLRDLVEVSPYYHGMVQKLMKPDHIRKPDNIQTPEKLGRWESCTGGLEWAGAVSKQNG